MRSGRLGNVPIFLESDRAKLFAARSDASTDEVKDEVCYIFWLPKVRPPTSARRVRRDVGKSSGETYAATLRQLRPNAKITIVAPADDDAQIFEPAALRAFDAVFVTGSPLHVYDDTPEVRRQLAFMRNVFASTVPSFGSCAGLQLAVAAAGGKVRKMPARMEAGIARRITQTEAGRGHPLLVGRAASWDAPAIHGDEVEALPADAILLASNAVTAIQAAEIRHDGGTFWGVQYHPELALGEIAAALRRQAADIVDAGLADTIEDVETRATQLDALHDAPDRQSLLWALGVDSEFADEAKRRIELSNFLGFLTQPGIDGRRLRNDAPAESNPA